MLNAPINHSIISVAKSLDILAQQNVNACVYKRGYCPASCYISSVTWYHLHLPRVLRPKEWKLLHVILKLALGQTMILHKKLESGCYVKHFENKLKWFRCLFGAFFDVFNIGGPEHSTVFVQVSENTVSKPYSAIMKHTCISKDRTVNSILWASDM